MTPLESPPVLEQQQQQVTYYTDQVNDIIQRIKQRYHIQQQQQHHLCRLLISLAGIPGSGKSTFSHQLIQQLNKQQHLKSIVIPQDGFHLHRSQLSQLPNPEEAFKRRGAPFTFNPQAFVELIRKLKDPDWKDKTIYAPSFDHKLKDPIEDEIKIDSDVEVIIIEGNYVSLTDEYWNDISELVDESWFIQTGLSVVRDRIIKRHLQAGISSTMEEAIERTDGNDLVNAKYILEHSKPTDVVIITKE
ncbi:uncharacterized protein J8A68_005895 [[Candida] subhashii]|uniref:Phosphoribulokinase/uridine kinase domain-containing protein n=1 Tax=[Candida] subhashii TaxID=561895 RepID=A0A8J5Q1M2_9ASCO|nr:uncharacterized protein J8A68_005895 [[Candida] subhashii]KAG7660629.1 hypothetical protein J8A68_005895 [[Candida] subhashii]